jgi:ATP-dependent Lhr-like helicase
MSLAHFHPVTARWFAGALGTPTAAQLEGWAAIRQGRHTLIAAPTGSGKTLAAFLSALDDLLQEGLRAPLPDEVRVVYVSPLKALSADIHRNLALPRRGLRQLAEELGVEAPHITAAVRTGDTSQAERAAMLRTPPHVLVTTPESLYLLLTADRSRDMLRTTRTVIVDEIHAVVGTRRGAHLALSLERLQSIAERPLLRLGLSATQKPIEEVAQFLVGASEPGPSSCAVVDEGHRRAMDLGVEVPKSPLEAVMSHEIWEEYYERLTGLIAAHRTTLVFVNTRRMAERVARHLSDRLGADAVTAHHGSLSKETRLDAEARLKTGQLKALVATASLELGIDIGHVDLVCQIGSPHRIATLLQRVGRSGHTVRGLPKGRLFATSRDDLVECAALMAAVRRGDLDRVVWHEAPLDVLTQQIVAETACREYGEGELFALVRRAWPYRALTRDAFDAVVKMAADGFSTTRGRRGALVHRDEVHARLRGRRGSRLTAITSGGAIPEVADYRVVLDPDETFIGTLNEDFAIESMAGDVFQLGNASWRVLQVSSGVVRVADAKGAPPNIPFWLGEAPARSDELSRAVGGLRADIERVLREPGAAEWLVAAAGLSREAAEQVVAYLGESQRVLGVLPTQDTLVLERFFDESGGMQLVLHAPFGSRINKAWGLALRKRFCRQFNFELQAAATEEGLLLSLGPQHSFPLDDVFRYLHPATARDVLVQAFLDAPVFKTRWRWNTTIALAVPRNRGGRKVPPQLQRMLAEDLLAAVFPDAAACLENIPGDRQLPDHPLVNQTVRDCLDEAMDFEGLAGVLTRIHRGEIRCVARDLPEPSPLCHEMLTARPYAFLDDAPLEERRTQAVYARRAGEPSAAGDLGALDAAAIERARSEQRPDARDADELHDEMMAAGLLTGQDVAHLAPRFLSELASTSRAARADVALGAGIDRQPELWIAAERLPEWRAVHPSSMLDPALAAPASRTGRSWTREEALIELLRGRLTIEGPRTADDLAATLRVPPADVETALLALESEGVVLRGHFDQSARPHLQWCDRTLLARIHRYTLNRLRAEIEPVSPADYMRFLFVWQHVDPSSRLSGLDGLRAAIAMLDGFEAPAASWEKALLPARLARYEPGMLDTLSLAGEIGWGRLSTAPTPVGGGTPVALFLREHGPAWQALRRVSLADDGCEQPEAPDVQPDEAALRVLETLRIRGASFFRELSAPCELDDEALEQAIVRLVSAGLIVSDGLAGLRAIVALNRRRPRSGPASVRFAGRWSLVAPREAETGVTEGAALEMHAWALLKRYGVICRRVLAREANAAPWRMLARVFRRLEARGEIRGGRFVTGLSGEQFALADAVERLREVRRSRPDGRLTAVSAADPLNLAGIVNAGERVRAVAANRIVYRDGIPLAALEGDYLRPLSAINPSEAADVAGALAGRRVPAVVGGYVGRARSHPTLA